MRYVDTDADRCAAATALGAEVTHLDGAWPRRFDRAPIVVENTADVDGLACALRSTDDYGTCTSVAIHFAPTTPMPLLELYTKGITYHLSRADSRQFLPEVIALAASGALDPLAVPTTIVPWDRGRRGLAGAGDEARARAGVAGEPVVRSTCGAPPNTDSVGTHPSLRAAGGRRVRRCPYMEESLMSAASRPRLRGLCVLAALCALFVAAPAANAATTTPVIQAPVAGGTYLALGDSLAFGYQQAEVNACAGTGCTSPDTQFSTGYVDVFGQLFGANTLGVTTVNLGCPGETSVSLVNATNATTGCTTYPFAIHDNHPGKTQLQAAVDTLQRFGKRVSPITVGIGANDVLGLVAEQCTTAGVISIACVQANAPATFATVQPEPRHDAQHAAPGWRREARDHRRRALQPALPGDLQQTYGRSSPPAAARPRPRPRPLRPAAGTDALAAQLNSLQSATAAKYRAVFADPLPVFNPQGAPAGRARHDLHADRRLRPAAGHPPDGLRLRSAARTS